MVDTESKLVTAEENYLRVVEWQGDGPRKAWSVVLLGYAESIDGMLAYELPKFPEKDVYFVEPWNGKSLNPRKVAYSYKDFDGAIRMEVLNSGLPRAQQKWKAPALPKCWSLDALDKMARDKGWVIKRAGKEIPDFDKFREAENLTDEQYEHAVREWHRRIFGVFIWINGTLTYLTGEHYYYLSVFRIDTGLPQYRDRDRRWYYAVQVAIEDKRHMGLVYLKHRRDGATYRCGGIVLNTATKGYAAGANGGIISKDDKSSAEAFKTKVVMPFQKMPFYFSPNVKDKTDVEKILEFRTPPRAASDKYSSNDMGLESFITYKPPGKKGKGGFDGFKIHVMLVDEIGKFLEVSILEVLRIIGPAMDLDGVWGLILCPSTNEDLEGDNKDEFEKLWNMSDPATRLKSANKATISKMLRYFTPAYDGLGKAWIGEFGESIVHKPSKDQLRYLMSLDDDTVETYSEDWKQGGSYEYLVRERACQEDLSGFMRLYPFTPEESFRSTNPECFFNLDNLNSCMEALMQPTPEATNVVLELTERGRFEWVDNKFMGPDGVYWVKDSRGPFLVNKPYMEGGEAAKKLGFVFNNVNRMVADGKPTVFNKSGSVVKIGMDPQKQDSDEATGHKSGLSKAGAHGFYPYDPGFEKDPWDETIPNFAANFTTHACLFEYHLLPKDSNATHEDMLKACIYWNAKFHSEKQVFEAIKYFKKMGANKLIFRDIELNGVNRHSKQIVAGQAANENTEIMANNRIKDFVEYHCYPSRFPFVDTIKQLIKYNKKNVNQLDLKVSFGFTLMAVQPGVVMGFKAKPPPEHTAPEKPDIDKWTRRHTSLSPGLSL